MKFHITGILFLLSSALTAQLPGFEIYLMDMPFKGSVNAPVNITNHPGYDNQPSFSPDGKYILYAAHYDTAQSDIYKYDLLSKTTTKITATPESEYSPEVTPDKKHISVVRVEMDSAQRFCLYNLKGKQPHLMLDSFKLIGYYGWYDPSTVALFNLPEPFQFVMTDLKQTNAYLADLNIGRCLKRIPGQNSMSYLVKANDSIWEIRREIMIGDSTEMIDYMREFIFGGEKKVIEIPAGSEDFAWTPDGSSILMARGAELFYLDVKGDMQWHLSTDLSQFGIKKVYRLAISPDGKQLAFVAEE